MNYQIGPTWQNMGGRREGCREASFWPLKNVPPTWQRLWQIPNQRCPPQCHLSQRDPHQPHDVVVQVYVWDRTVDDRVAPWSA